MSETEELEQAVNFWRDEQKRTLEMYKKECDFSKEMFNEAIKYSKRCAFYAYAAFWSSVLSFVIGLLIGGLK